MEPVKSWSGREKLGERKTRRPGRHWASACSHLAFLSTDEDNELVWILGGKWQILNSQLLKQRRDLLEVGEGCASTEPWERPSCPWAQGPGMLVPRAAPRPPQPAVPKPPARSFCLRKALQLVLRKKIPKNSLSPGQRVDQLTLGRYFRGTDSPLLSTCCFPAVKAYVHTHTFVQQIYQIPPMCQGHHSSFQWSGVERLQDVEPAGLAWNLRSTVGCSMGRVLGAHQGLLSVLMRRE